MWVCFLPMIITNIFFAFSNTIFRFMGCDRIEFGRAKKGRRTVYAKADCVGCLFAIRGTIGVPMYEEAPSKVLLFSPFISGSFLFSSFVCFDRRQTIVLSLDFCARTRPCVCLTDVSGLINGERGSETKG
jgi:hypothetical protein